MKPIIIGVAGGTASGKTTVSEAILERVGRDQIAYLKHGSYYRDLGHLRIEERVRLNFDHPDALETELLVEHLRRLQAGESIEVPEYDFATYTRTGRTRHVEPQGVILVEGILIFVDRQLREMMDVKLYVDTDADLRLIRRMQRDICERRRTLESVIRQYLETVRPMHLEFVEPSKRYADVIIPEGGFNATAIEMVVARIQTLLASSQQARGPAAEQV
jgi:uridine kinase